MLREWQLKISVNRDAAIPLHMQIVHAIVGKIKAGLLRPGASLPGTRDLAAGLGVNRKTVVLAYDELVAQGWLAAQNKRGTFISSDLPEIPQEGGGKSVPRAQRSALPAPSYRLYGTEGPLPSLATKGVIEFTDGVPDTRVVPFGALSSAFRHALIESSRGNQLGYGDPRGLPSLRNLLAKMLRMERELNVDEDTLCLVRGSQMGIYLAARLLVRQGDAVAFERLTYPPARNAFRACGASIVDIDHDEDGMVPASLEKACRQHQIRAVYVTPNHQFPTTVAMPISRRMRLLELAEQFDFVIVEDDYDHEFNYTHNPMLPVASVDRTGRVIYIGSLSKILAPGLRIGYVVAPSTVINRLANEIMLIDRQGNSVTERAVAELMLSGELKRHIKRAVRVYQARCQLATDLVQQKLTPFAYCRPPAGGLALWLELDRAIDMSRLMTDAESEFVKVLPGTQFSQGEQVHALRLGFGSLNELEIAEGFGRLKSALMRQRVSGKRGTRGR